MTRPTNQEQGPVLQTKFRPFQKQIQIHGTTYKDPYPKF